MPVDNNNEDDFSVYDETIKIRRNTFINSIKKSNPNAYNEYKKIEKQAKEGQDPFRILIEILGKENESLREEIRYILIRERLISPSNEDVEKLSEVLKEHEIDLKLLCNEIQDPRAIADIIVHMNLEKYLDKSSLGGIYFIVDKIVSVNKKPTVCNLSLKTLPSVHLTKPVISDIFSQILINQYLKEFQKDFNLAENDLVKKIIETNDDNLRKIFESVLKYYRDLKEFKIKGIKNKIIDTETNQEVNFPGFHQKITAMKLLKDKRILLADDMGLGKTAQAIISKYAIEQENYKKTGNQTKVTSLVVVPTNDLSDYWKSQIELFCEEKPSIGIIKSSNKHKVDELIKQNPDFIIITYDMIFREINGKKLGSHILENSNVSYVVLDEGHNVKNANSLRSKEIEQITTSEKIKHLLILSGSPFPNGFRDVGVTIHLLKPDKYSSPKDFVNAFSKNPRLVRSELLSHLIRRTNIDVYGERDCETNIIKIEPNSFQSSLETVILSDDSNALEKIQKLRKLFIDPSLMGYDGVSEKYNLILENVKSNNGKSIIFSSDLRDGITEKLEDFLNDNGVSTVRIDGTVQGKEREKVLKEFREGNPKVLVTTLDTMGEGNDLSCANNVGFLDIPFTHAEYRQGVARANRKGQKEKVNVNLYMYNGSIDEKLWKVIHQKLKIEQFLLDSMKINDSERKFLDETPDLVKKKKEDNRVNMYKIFALLRGKSTLEVIKNIGDNKQISEFIAKTYDENFEKSYAYHSAKLCSTILNQLESENISFNNILDIASNSAIFSRVSKRKTTCLDINQAALDIGKERLLSMGIEIETVKASFMNMPFDNNSFDVAIFSLAIDLAHKKEREVALYEAARVVKVGGLFILTSSMRSDSLLDRDKTTIVLENLGFKVLPQLTGIANGEPKSSKFKVDLYTCLKVSETKNELTGIDFSVEFEQKVKSDKPSEIIECDCEPKEKVGCDFFKINGIELDNAIENTLKNINAVESVSIHDEVIELLKSINSTNTRNEVIEKCDSVLDLIIQLPKNEDTIKEKLFDNLCKIEKVYNLNLRDRANSTSDKIKKIERNISKKVEIKKGNTIIRRPLV